MKRRQPPSKQTKAQRQSPAATSHPPSTASPVPVVTPPTAAPRRPRPVRRRSRRLSPTAIVGIAALVVALGAGIYYLAREPEPRGPIQGVVAFPNLERGHQTEPVVYPQTPPVGGNHAPAWQNCGVYDQPVKNENGVHTLEHGAVWITYRPDVPAAEREALRAVARQSGYRLLSPYPDLPSPIVASAWGAQLRLDRADDPRLTQFIRRYEQDPSGPEPGAPCTGGLGRPSA